eukprot:CAMPEP_0202872670 /NCGR_PEP_ID=MMETSP1391-20130828/21736_1 /ASSEMBLY_ACC=CAM_ASM_000867 /TAXON_ID=1034604 /ORGANISM="Chlamydomonas leiostraca, Strain SAG 11-49" /LENGTH=143 /DNA_ID=CAMNT_0049553771 /DNA_START=22 /DNA_END=455 /DNA_ORIENTATION=+
MAFAVSAKAGVAPVAASRGKLQVVCATGPRHKGAKHHARSRPIKYTPADKRHGPAKYPEMPAPPPEVVVVSAAQKKKSPAGHAALAHRMAMDEVQHGHMGAWTRWQQLSVLSCWASGWTGSNGQEPFSADPKEWMALQQRSSL